MTAPTPASESPSTPTCCGEGGGWAAAGKALVPGCDLCPKSPTYWRAAENRSDGQPYRPTPPLGM
jgi:hypothetical protein